ncbi:serine/threonine-protein kinase RUNKEL [Magnolia sinica]|uniref:serine/threonine-protein kinase RUNKEL n=1 Tax=Magnolia sinica TaxID=86752 RepID=UPI002658C094|nr:serine/threonine-protein kinase RUNKEL [Magnolia sinica]
MNQYHIYEAIGKGKHSTVYKGRKKKTIEYFAVKSVDKSQKNKLLQEVRILHSLSHPNVLKFYSWYETSAHLWLVLEYCVGGDLLTLLHQDSQLPEDSLHDLARDLVKALQFLHSKGIIYCDLKPSNILLDENGRMKLCDFGLSRRLNEISKSSLSTLPQAKRGTPCYMAPELFQDGGVHSYASDFWALGCVLYECYSGKPPFVGKEFTQLVKSILSDPVPPLLDNPSNNFVSLINCLLIKDPAERVQWPELCQHDFWKTKFTPVPLPPQPAFDDMVQLLSKPYLSERNSDKPLQQRTPPKNRERDPCGVIKQDGNFNIRSKGFETPAKNLASGRRIQTKASDKVMEEKQKEATKEVNLLRLSRIAKSNLRKENEKENYRRPLPESSENDAEVKIENNDMELDFGENSEEDAHDESDNRPSTPGEKFPIQTHDHERVEEMINNSNQSNILADSDMTIPEDPNTLERESCSENVEVAATPPSVGLQRRGQRIKTGSGSVPDSDLSNSSPNLSQAHWHPSDLSVRPVMPSRKGDKASEAMPLLPFDAPNAYDFVKLPSEQLDALNNRIILILNGNSPVSEKQNTIRYLEMLSGHVDAANTLTNGSIMLVLVKMLRLSKVSVLRVQLASLIGLLIRHSTFIETDLASSGIMGALTDGLRDKQEKVRRFSMAALGELLFYISTQNEHARDGTALESPSKDSRSTTGWQVPSPLIALVSSILRKGEDDVTQLYALRTIENICSQGGDWAARFTSQDVIGNLCYIYKATGKQESTRLTAGSCLVRLARFSPPSIQSVFEKLSFKEIATALVKGSPREQQISLNLLNIALSESHLFTNMGRHILSLFEEKQLLPSLISLIEQGTEALRGKALVFVALLCKCSRRWLPQFFCNARLLSAVDRLAKEKDSYLKQCMGAFVHAVAATVPWLMDAISGDIQQMMGGKRHGQIAALTGRTNPRTNIHLLPVILHLLGSASFKHRVVTSQVLQQLANLLKLLEASFQGRDDFQITLLRILESITEEPSVILEDPKIFISQVLPSLAILYNGNKDGDARFLCLKNLFDVMVVFLNDFSDTMASEDKQRSSDLKLLSYKYFLPLYPFLIEDEDPIPMYAQKLLVMLIEFDFVKVSDILQPKTVSQCFEFLLGDLASANVNNVKLCLALASALEMETKILSQLRVVRRIGNLLEFVNAKEMEDFLEPTLGLCKVFIRRAIGCRKGSDYSKEPDLLSNATFDMSVAVDSIKDISDFGSNIGVFLELCGTQEVQIADLASDCLVLLMKAAPREATTGLLTNLSKISNSLEFCCQAGDSSLLLLRLLHALGFSCRQYLSQAMILSISIADVTRIETILSDLRSSSIRGIADAASIVWVELQRLPRYI